MRIAIIGAGWNGCHLAIELTKAGHDITVLEKHSTIFSGCSGMFGIRLHRGPHYPRSKATRDGCHAAFERFCEAYPEIIKQHQDSIYARGERDAEGCPSRTSAHTFEDVCFETEECEKVDAEAKAIRGVTAAYDLDEPSVAVGAELRSFFERKLAAQGVTVLLDIEVQRIRRRPYGPLVVSYRTKSPANRRIPQTGILDADFVVNATGYQSLTPNLTPPLDGGERGGGGTRPMGLDVVYQACIAFRYEDTAPGERPFSFIVMDGWFPCLMPSIDDGGPPAAHDRQLRENKNGHSNGKPRSAEVASTPPPPQRHYILTHGSYTILGSFPRPEQAQQLLDRVCLPPPSPSAPRGDRASTNDASHPASQLRAAAEAEICRFWPLFRSRFRYRGCQGSVLAKLRTGCEFRSSVVFARERIVYVFPGKISNIFRACDDVRSLIAAGAAVGGEGAGRKGKGKGDRDADGDARRWGEGSGDCIRGERPGGREVVVVDGYSFVRSAWAEIEDARAHRDEKVAISGGDVDVGVNNDVQAAAGGAGKGRRSTCDLQTFESFLKGARCGDLGLSRSGNRAAAAS